MHKFKLLSSYATTLITLNNVVESYTFRYAFKKSTMAPSHNSCNCINYEPMWSITVH